MIKEIYNKLWEIKDFEKRLEQVDISNTILKSIEENRPALIEAETGSGKTLAYLIPAILHNINTGKKVVISTNRINLQDQILNKELPFLEKILDKKLNYMLVKGRNNYVCLRKLNEIFLDNPNVRKLVYEIESSLEGDKEEIKSPIKSELWNNIKSDKDTTLARNCPYYNKCYYYNNRKKINENDILIVNHNILLVDLILKNQKESSLLPEYDLVVLDEVHNLESILRQYFSKSFSFQEIFKNIGQLFNRNSKNIENSGYLYILVENYLLNDKEEAIENINKLYDNLVIIFKFINKEVPKTNLLGDIFSEFKSKEIYNSLDLLKKIYCDLKKDFSDFNVYFENSSDENILKNLILASNFYNNIFKQLEVIFEIFKYNFEKYIHWIKYEENTVFPILNITPYDVSNDFKDKFLNKYTKSIFTSATLTTDNNFEYIKSSLGIENAIEKKVTSTFNYKEQMNLYVVYDLPEPNTSNFIEEVSQFCYNYTLKNKGKTFILFTSYLELNKVYSYFENQKSELNLLKQGDLNRRELINKFKIEENSVLFGTDSFWEGVDVKGEALSNVIIVKIPFQVPNDPIVYGISQKIKGSFLKNQLPYAIIKMKQGIGRLIRSKYDRGNIVILDKRLVEKNYGKVILRSFPTANLSIVRKDEL